MSTIAAPSNAHAPLLVEILTEELPPKALARLGEAFGQSLARSLHDDGLSPNQDFEWFASPRRLAVRLKEVLSVGAARPLELKGPSVKVALDAQGQPTAALQKWAEKQGVTPAQLVRASDGKQECFYWKTQQPGVALAAALGPAIQNALANLPIPKMMQYQLIDGVTSVSFVRPVHRLLTLHGGQVVVGHLMGMNADRLTEGHRFLHEGTIAVADAASYEGQLQASHVIASFAQRQARIAQQLLTQAHAHGGRLSDRPGYSDQAALEGSLKPYLDEVTALVEWPEVYVGQFEDQFLQVPQECLILTMRTNQKYFPLFDERGTLTSKFLIVSNMQVADPANIVDGNQRVVRPRLADAQFFFEQDRKTSLAARVPQLAQVVYHAKLGTQAQRAQRVARLAKDIATRIGAQPEWAVRAAQLAKADLLTGMVGEFPELQGTMGRYYAQHDGEPAAVAQAIAEHYQPRFAGDALPASREGLALALADKLETLTGIWGVGQQPTGDKDPFALRRHALGILRMLVELKLPLALKPLIGSGFANFEGNAQVKADVDGVHAFMLDRLRAWLRDQGHDPKAIEAVLSVAQDDLSSLRERLEAVRQFAQLPEAESLAGANKRIGNLLRKNAETADGASPAGTSAVDPTLLEAPAEKALYQELKRLTPDADNAYDAGRFSDSMKTLASLRPSVDAFFDQVMVMAEQADLRRNRFALLKSLSGTMNRVADLAKLA